MNLVKDKFLIVFSGGQDSTTCLHWVLNYFKKENPDINRADYKKYIKLVTFNYGQRHDIELEAAKKIAELADLEFDLVDIPNVLRGASSLTDTSVTLPQNESLDDFETGLANTFVPGRNLLFLTIAANLAYSHGVNKIVTGVCETDFAGYYDCRQDFIKAMELTVNQALFGENTGIEIITPLMYLTKADTVSLAKDLGEECLKALAYSHTCYQGVFPPCGKCHACHLRAKGFQEAKVEDPLLIRASKGEYISELTSK
ncbi:MAG: 7-cyano-7-deazaguanine synthase QueC [Candidatus Caenarcaniphilales bacterium]|nr:7-cyano-7-deazaguanine synthase QueC [Candidatus Caenarcaniphilales bacterium]